MSYERLLWALVSEMTSALESQPVSEVWQHLIDNLPEEKSKELVAYIKHRYDLGWIYKAGMSYLQDRLNEV